MNNNESNNNNNDDKKEGSVPVSDVGCITGNLWCGALKVIIDVNEKRGVDFNTNRSTIGGFIRGGPVGNSPHFHSFASLRLQVMRSVLALLSLKTLVPCLVPFLELDIGWGAGSQKHGDPIPKNAALGEGSVSIFLGELVRIKVFPGSFASAH